MQTYGKPRFHICKCSVIDEFISIGRFKQHYVRANSEPVPVIDLDDGRRLKQIQNKLNRQTKLEINSKNNVEIYNNYWKKEVAPLIKYDCFDANFPTIEDILPYCYLADLMFDDNIKKPLTISEKLDVVLK